jgi:hypothetical protein
VKFAYIRIEEKTVFPYIVMIDYSLIEDLFCKDSLDGRQLESFGSSAQFIFVRSRKRRDSPSLGRQATNVESVSIVYTGLHDGGEVASDRFVGRVEIDDDSPHYASGHEEHAEESAA